MKKIAVVSLLLMMSLATGYAQHIAPASAPNETQKRMQERGYGMFIHFGVNTFADMEWSDGTIPVEQYNPTSLDCDQWVRVARDAGFRYVLLVTKHHDGFCLWDSEYTDYDVASSPVKTDVVAGVADACRKYGLQFAVYYSLWDRSAPCYKDEDPEKYIDYMCGQLKELLTCYGPVCELWLDGGWDREVKDWNLQRVYGMVKELQPYCAVSVNHTIVATEWGRDRVLPDYMTADNKYYLQYFPCDFRLWDPIVAHKKDKKQYLYDGKSYYLPYEHTICISKYWSWFAKKEPQPTRDIDELEELFYWCTDNGNTLVMNLPPDQSGRIREHEANAAIMLGKRLGLTYGKSLPRNGEFISVDAPAEASSWMEGHGASNAVDGGMKTFWAAKDTLASLTVALDSSKPFNKLSIFEYCDTEVAPDGFTTTRSNRIKAYAISIHTDNEWRAVYVSDETMGDCKVIRFPVSYHADKIRLDILDASAPPAIYEFNVINMP